MHTSKINGYTKIWLSANDTRDWAHKAGASWPCSTLSGKHLFAEFEPSGDLVEFNLNNGRGDQDCPADELNAIVADHIGTSRPSAD